MVLDFEMEEEEVLSWNSILDRVKGAIQDRNDRELLKGINQAKQLWAGPLVLYSVDHTIETDEVSPKGRDTLRLFDRCIEYSYKEGYWMLLQDLEDSNESLDVQRLRKLNFNPMLSLMTCYHDSLSDWMNPALEWWGSRGGLVLDILDHDDYNERAPRTAAHWALYHQNQDGWDALLSYYPLEGLKNEHQLCKKRLGGLLNKKQTEMMDQLLFNILNKEKAELDQELHLTLKGLSKTRL